MPFEIRFVKPVPPLDRETYLNECCVGGDVVMNRLLPAIRHRYPDVEEGQEDRGWFVWFRKGIVALAVDIFTYDPGAGSFRIHLTSRKKRWLLFDIVEDTPEQEELQRLVASELAE
jgi:hypothetical protein